MPELVTQGSRRLGAALKELRELAGLRIEEVAGHLDQNPGTVSRYENGRLKPKWPTVVMMTNHYGATDEQGKRIRELYDAAKSEPKPVRLPSGAPSAFRRLVYETTVAWRMRQVGGLYVHGLLQIESYTQALRETLHGPEASQVKQFGVRAKRQKRIEPADPKPLEYHAILDEIAMTRQVGGPSVLLEQLRHIADVAENWDNVTVQVVKKEAGDYGFGSGGMTLVDYDNGEPTWAYSESIMGAQLMEDSEGVQRFAEMFDRAARIASTPDESIKFIRQQIEVLENL
ncbi:helix-turn-helix domain-containing protein [Amycolatopsis rubida]|uniref:Helix-turn-helix domain-containing protein n=1 Tax=Amycolatopsis rubida TaxID=112413 RepID=A0ABX0C521_9PSEU|nr:MULTISPECIES: helix-turn-helix transcriptional regulator [Amycolatopsis]MYW90504.1 helix-turn-helix domain-containing protein [Amycolatopsis rubida]MYW95128.1 helix-turn-helix domain-containing protein [Amycolatopsis rubida]NEC55483.1 helix-turn-helix domain-containing protein [Amycolatopsis rubida]NEC60116.1 helix-turn-helix domain-containing protein [Amycolatopsis rubida]